jgi:hypothetical protein
MGSKLTKSKMGRPSRYKTEFARATRQLCKLGATDADLAAAFEVSIPTIDTWKAKHPDFLGSLKAGKEEADDRVERALYSCAVGYSYDAVKIFMAAGASEPIYAPYVEHIPPDVTVWHLLVKKSKAGSLEGSVAGGRHGRHHQRQTNDGGTVAPRAHGDADRGDAGDNRGAKEQSNPEGYLSPSTETIAEAE